MGKKKWIIIATILILLISIPITVTIINQIKIKNIFDEIYYDERTALSDGLFGSGDASLAQVKGMKPWNRSGPHSFELTPFFETYSNDVLPEGIVGLSYMFSFAGEKDNGSFSITIQKELSDNVIVYLGYNYKVKDKKLTKTVGVEDKFLQDDDFTRDTDKVKKYLEEYSTNLKEMEQVGNSILRDKLLTDWCSVYNSRFSPDDFGDVKVKKTY
ncbi:TipC family immunity protein [Listeria sp. ILCC797]|uniref:TipC family immunity protein n=1 Tax=Listeria sp. ILCC797 TaxID=1918333 RepID=UPI000B58DAA7|nr:TipC family immunity protein [Listeria sp. ILCC797]